MCQNCDRLHAPKEYLRRIRAVDELDGIVSRGKREPLEANRATLELTVCFRDPALER
jgi:hypothetical protein